MRWEVENELEEQSPIEMLSVALPGNSRINLSPV
ncbi:MAG: hypothetical protein RI973_1499, partial [Bacteroidota bacterium]